MTALSLTADPSSSLSSALHWRDCRPHAVLRPSATEHIADLVMALHRASQQGADSPRYLVRATQQGFHSSNNFSCPLVPRPSDAAAAAAAGDGSSTAEGRTAAAAAAVLEPSSSRETYTVVLDMTAMAQMVRLDADLEEATITVQAGMSVEALEDLLFEHKLSMPNVVITPALSGMSLGAALVTGAHGSALEGHATLAPYVRRAVLVDGTGEVRVLEWPGELLEGSLGLLGVVTEITLLVAPRRKVLVKQLQAEDIEMVGDIREIVDQSRALALDVTWSPTAGMYTARVWHASEAGEDGEARNAHMQAPPAWLDKVDSRLHRDQKDKKDRSPVMCELLGDLSTFPFFKDVEGTPSQDLVGGVGLGAPNDAHIGWLNHMASPRCPDGEECLWRRARMTQHELGISAEDLGAWVDDTRRVMATARNCPSFVFHLRFVPGASSPLAMHFNRHTVAIDISTFGSRAAPGLHVKQQALLDEILQLTLCRYEGRPHWGAATNRMFTGPCPVRDMYGPQLDAFLALRPDYDPFDLFLAPLFQRVIERRGSDLYPGCAADNECFCQEDNHCGAHHVCVPAAVFPEFNVCAPEDAAAATAGREL